MEVKDFKEAHILTQFAAIALYLAGIILAQGFWSTLVAALIPPWGVVVVVAAILG